MTAADKTYDPSPARKVAFIGLGTMGAPMAVHLLRAGHEVTVYNRTAAKARAWVAEAVADARARTEWRTAALLNAVEPVVAAQVRRSANRMGGESGGTGARRGASK